MTDFIYRPLQPIIVELSRKRIEFAINVGVQRRLMNRFNGVYQPLGTSEKPWDNDIEGALGECAVAQELGWFWDGNLGNVRAADVGRLQVRTTRHVNGGLILHEDDKDDDTFILCRGGDGRYAITAHCKGRDGKRLEFWRTPYTVPRLDPAAFLVDTQPALQHIQPLFDKLRAA